MEFPGFRLDGRVVLVTGGSGSLGALAALAFAHAGADVAVAARGLERCEEVATRVRALGRRALAVAVDVTRAEAVEAGVERTVAALGPIDILFANAGVTSARPVLEVDEEDWRRVLEVNVTGTFLCARAVAPRMMARGGGRIITMGSILSRHGIASRAPYCAAKAAIANLTRALAIEFGPHGITVNAIAPTVIVTDMNRDLVTRQPELYRGVLERMPLGRLGEPVDIAGALVFLASPAAAFITGQTLYVDGGFTAT